MWRPTWMEWAITTSMMWSCVPVASSAAMAASWRSFGRSVGRSRCPRSPESAGATRPRRTARHFLRRPCGSQQRWVHRQRTWDEPDPVDRDTTNHKSAWVSLIASLFRIVKTSGHSCLETPNPTSRSRENITVGSADRRPSGLAEFARLGLLTEAGQGAEWQTCHHAAHQKDRL